MGLFRRLSNVFRPAALERELQEELDFHREMRLQKAREQGLTDAEAERATRLRMGNVSLARDGMRDARVVGWLASSLRDLRHGVVLLRRDAGISMMIVLVLALGIGGNAAVFTLLKTAFLDPLPYRDADRLVTIMENTGWMPSTSSFLEIRARNRTLEQVAFAEHRDMQLTGSGEPARVFAARVTASFFPVLGANAAIGRTFVEEDNQPGRTPTVVLTHAFWRSRMGGDPGIVGRTIRLDGAPAQVIGILSAGFHFDYPTLRIPDPVDIYVPYPLTKPGHIEVSGNGRGVPVRIVGRLRPGMTLADASADLRRIARELTIEDPGAFPNPQHNPSLFNFVVLSLRDAVVGTQRSLLWLLLGGVALLLLIACANTALLLLARSLRRGREIAIRVALGASRLRLVRQFLLEGLVLAVCGGAAGLISAGWIVRVLVHLMPGRTPLLAAAHVDGRTIAFTLAITLFSVMAFAVLPAVKGSRWMPGSTLNAKASTGEGNRWRHAMIAIEAALSVFLLCGAGLVAQNLWTLISKPMGFDPEHVLAMQLKLPARAQEHIDRKAGVIFQDYVDKIEAIPGVESAAIVTGPPLRPARGGNSELVGVRNPDGSLKSVIGWNHLVSAGYFKTMRIPLLAGRTLRRDDAGSKVTVAVVNEEFARQFGFGANIVGQAIDDGPGEPPIRIVGMVGNVRTRGLNAEPFPEGYISALQLAWANTYLVVRSNMPKGELLRQVKTAIASANSDQPVFGVMTMDEMIADAFAQPRFQVYLIGAFALLAVAMAAAGMYSVIACLVTQRTSEIAIRTALGASRRDIFRTMLGSATLWMAAGLACGLTAGIQARRTIQTLSGSAVAASPWIYVAVALFFFVVTIVAACVPVRRTSRFDPSMALRCE